MRKVATVLGIALLVVGIGGTPAVAAPEPFRESAWIFDDADIHNPSLVRLPDGRWRMYYMSPDAVLSAVSTTAAGTAFNPEGVRLAGATHPAAVRLPDGRVRLYYVSAPAPGQPLELRSAISEDGLTFQIEEGVRLGPGAAGSADAFGLIHPSVVRLPDGQWRVYYDAMRQADDGPRIGFGRAIMSATSADGLTFTRDRGYRVTPRLAGLRSASMVWSPEAYRQGRNIVLLFDVDTSKRPGDWAGIYQARSRDGLSFTLQDRDPVWGVAPGAKVEQGPGGPTAVPQDPVVIALAPGRQRLYYWLRGEGTGSAIR